MFNSRSFLLTLVLITAFAQPSLASDSDEELELHPLITCSAHHLIDLMDTSLSASLDDNLIGLMLNVSHTGELLVEKMSVDHEGRTNLRNIYQSKNDAVELTIYGSLFKGRIPIIENGSARFFSKNSMNIISNLHLHMENNIILNIKNGDLIITAPVMTFYSTFLEIPKGKRVIFHPPTNLSSFINCLQFTAKKDLICIQGTIDFNLPSFNNFMVTDADFKIIFNSKRNWMA